jgi:hypothetical protein
LNTRAVELGEAGTLDDVRNGARPGPPDARGSGRGGVLSLFQEWGIDLDRTTDIAELAVAQFARPFDSEDAG